MIFGLAIPRRNVRMDVLAIAIQRPAKHFVIAFITRANRFASAWPSITKQQQRDRINRKVKTIFVLFHSPGFSKTWYYGFQQYPKQFFQHLNG